MLRYHLLLIILAIINKTDFSKLIGVGMLVGFQSVHHHWKSTTEGPIYPVDLYV